MTKPTEYEQKLEKIKSILATRDFEIKNLNAGYKRNMLGWKTDDGSAEQDLMVRIGRSTERAAQAIDKVVAEAEKKAFLAGQKKGRNNYHLGYLSKDDQYAIERETIKARIDELENIFEWGYPGSANTGVATKHAQAPNNTIADRIAQLKQQQTKGDTDE